nr:hypothetical protein CFP56_63515 [Quercus suber]
MRLPTRYAAAGRVWHPPRHASNNEVARLRTVMIVRHGKVRRCRFTGGVPFTLHGVLFMKITSPPSQEKSSVSTDTSPAIMTVISYLLAVGSLASTAIASPIASISRRDAVRGQDSTCFPFGDAAAQLSKDYSVPDVSRQDWYCTYDQTYGFLGFSFPLEDSDCTADSNSYDSINSAFASMKADFGATMVRVYAPECREASIWENLLKAGVNNNMAVIPQIWWGFDNNQDLWMQSRDALLSMMSQYPIAPYVFHSVEFGSEPIGDGVDGDNFENDLQAFVNTMNGQYGVPVGISEDWDRPDILSTDDGSGLTDLGNQIKGITQVVHGQAPFLSSSCSHADQLLAHIMPYYHGRTSMLTSCYRADQSDHEGGQGDVGPDQYAAYWHSFDDNCSFFKDNQCPPSTRATPSPYMNVIAHPLRSSIHSVMGAYNGCRPWEEAMSRVLGVALKSAPDSRSDEQCGLMCPLLPFLCYKMTPEDANLEPLEEGVHSAVCAIERIIVGCPLECATTTVFTIPSHLAARLQCKLHRLSPAEARAEAERVFGVPIRGHQRALPAARVRCPFPDCISPE